VSVVVRPLAGTFRVIDLKLCAHVPLCQRLLVQSNSWLGHQGAKTKNTKSAITPEVVGDISWKISKHHTPILDNGSNH
jgi:predicted phosphohydrolase